MKESKINSLDYGPHKSLSIYIHIPFCDVICPYCDFNKFSKVDNLIPEFVDSIINEIELRSIKNTNIESLSFGGGTPSYLSNKDFELIFHSLKENFNFNQNIEISIEVNPKDINLEKVSLYEDLGINRISIGGQSFDDNILKKLGRNHNSIELINSLTLLKNKDFNNINLDLIYGVPGQSIETWEDSINKFIEFCFPHLSAYQLTYEPKTKFHRDLLANKITELGDETIVKMFGVMNSILLDYGYQNYEISNWSKPKMESVHNMRYWKKYDYLGFGPGASSFYENKRKTNTKSLKKYINNLKSSILEFEEDYTLNKKDNLIEGIMLDLRLSSGINHNEFNKKFDFDFNDKFFHLIKKLRDFKLIRNDNEKTILTQKGKLLSDSIFVLFQEEINTISF